MGIFDSTNCVTAATAPRQTVSGVNTLVPAGLFSVSITKTNGLGSISIQTSDANIYTMSVLNENFTDASDRPESALPSYVISATGGATWKWHGII